MAKELIDLFGLFRQRMSEKWVDIGTGIKIAGPSDPLEIGTGHRPDVVTVLWMIKGEVHKAGEGDRTAAARDFRCDLGNEFLMPGKQSDTILAGNRRRFPSSNETPVLLPYSLRKRVG